MLLTIVILIIYFNFPTFSQDGVSIDVVTGFSGRFSAGYWVPVNITINSQSTLQGELIVSLPIGDSHQRILSDYTIRRMVNLEPGQPQRIAMTLPIIRKEEITFTIIEGNKKLITKKSMLSPYGWKSKFILTLSRRAYIGISPALGWEVLSTHPETLPISSEGYASIHAVVLHDAPLYSISPGQIDALINWIKDGGFLIITGGIQTNQRISKKLTDLFPIQYQGSATISINAKEGELNSLSELPLRTGIISPDAQILNYENVTTGAVNRLGKGAIVVSLIDPDHAILSDWDGLSMYWKFLVNQYPETKNSYPLEDQLPGLVYHLIPHMPSEEKDIKWEAIFFLSPLFLIILLGILGKPQKWFFVLAVSISLISLLIIIIAADHDPPVYREISIYNQNSDMNRTNLLIKAGVSARKGGLTGIETESALVLPNKGEGLEIVNHGGSNRVILNRNPWEGKEFFATKQIPSPFNIIIDKKENHLKGEIHWENSNWESPILISGISNIENSAILIENDSLFFQFDLSNSENSEVFTQKFDSLSEKQKSLVFYLDEKGLFSPEEDGALAYLILLSEDKHTILNPDTAEKQSLKICIIGIQGETDEN